MQLKQFIRLYDPAELATDDTDITDLEITVTRTETIWKLMLLKKSGCNVPKIALISAS